MKVIISGGQKTENITNAMIKHFQSSVSIGNLNYLDELKDYLDRGDTFDRLIVMQQSITHNGEIEDTSEIANILDNFVDIVSHGLEKQEIIFISTDEDLAELIYGITFSISNRAKVLLYQENAPFKTSFFKSCVTVDINNIDESVQLRGLEYKPKDLVYESEDSEEFKNEDSEDTIENADVPDNFESEGFDNTDDFGLDGDGFGSTGADTSDEFGNTSDNGDIGGLFGDLSDVDGSDEFGNSDGLDDLGDGLGDEFGSSDELGEFGDNLDDGLNDGLKSSDNFGDEFGDLGDELNGSSGGTNENADELDDFELDAPSKTSDSDDFGLDTPSKEDDSDNSLDSLDGSDSGDFSLDTPSNGKADSDDFGLDGSESDDFGLDTPSNESGSDDFGFDGSDDFGLDTGSSDSSDDFGLDDSSDMNDNFGMSDSELDIDKEASLDDFGFESSSNESDNQGIDNSDLFDESNDVSNEVNKHSENADEMNEADLLDIDDTSSNNSESNDFGNVDDFGNANEVENNNIPNNVNANVNANVPTVVNQAPPKKKGFSLFGRKNKQPVPRPGVQRPDAQRPGAPVNNNVPVNNAVQRPSVPRPGVQRPGAPVNNRPAVPNVNNQVNRVPSPAGQMNNNSANDDKARIVELLRAYKSRGNTIVCSGTKESGTSTLVANLANVIAVNGYTVLVVDLDYNGRTQCIINSELFNNIHEADPNMNGLRYALNNKSGDLIGYTMPVKEGYNVLTTGLGVDLQKLEDVVRDPRNIRDFLYTAKGQYDFVIFDCPFEKLIRDFKDIALNIDNIVLDLEPDSKDLIEFMMMLCNVEDVKVRELLFNRAGIIFNKYVKHKYVLGKKNPTPVQMLKSIDEIVYNITGYSQEFYKMHIINTIPSDERFEDFMFSKKFISDTPEGMKLYLNVLRSILENY